MEQDNGGIEKAIQVLSKISKEVNFCCNASMDTEEVLVLLEEVIETLNELKK
tara:strand:- start:138 stop:293 length:156 start_codon:yes stop_codon:yes gene_type:complete